MSKKLALLIIIQILLIFGPKNDLLSKLTAVIGVSTPPGGGKELLWLLGTNLSNSYHLIQPILNSSLTSQIAVCQNKPFPLNCISGA